MASSATSPKPVQKETAPAGRGALLKWLVPVALALVLRLIPTPAGLSPAAWHYFALFVAVIAGRSQNHSWPRRWIRGGFVRGRLSFRGEDTGGKSALGADRVRE